MAKWFKLAELTYTRAEAILTSAGRKVALVPVGSTEAHGPHLPLCTDSLIAESMAERGAARLAESGFTAVVFPTIHYAVTDWAGDFCGSTSLSAQTDEALVFETCRAAQNMGFWRVVLCNAHLEPDNIATLRGVAKRYEKEMGIPLLFPDVTRRRNAERLGEEFKSGSCHAGQYESSLVLAIRPDLVDRSAAAALPNHFVPLHEKIAAGAKSFLDCGMDRAYCGDPAAATAQEGQEILATLADLVVEVVSEQVGPETE